MSLKARITEDMKTAMKGGEKERLGVIRLILAALKQREVDERIVLDDTQILAVLEKMLKQRRDSFQQFTAAAREDLAKIEAYEIDVIEAYLPAKLSADELAGIVSSVIAEVGATGPKDMGKIMGPLKARVAGRADMGALSELVKQKLAALV